MTCVSHQPDLFYIYTLFPLLEQPGLEIPPYFRTPEAPGAHISVIYETERQALPRTLEAAVCILVQYFSSQTIPKTRLFSDGLCTYTRCQEALGRDRLVVGGFSSDGLDVVTYQSDVAFLGVAALRKF